MKEYLRLYIKCRSYNIKIKVQNELLKEEEIVLNFIDLLRYNNRTNQIAFLQYNIHNPKK